MKKSLCFFIISIVFSCQSNIVENSYPDADIDFRAKMKNFVKNISSYARSKDIDFIIIPQNGCSLITVDGEPAGSADNSYLSSVSGFGQEDLYFGYDEDDQATPVSETDAITPFLDKAISDGKKILVTDYCWTDSKMNESYSKNDAKSYISFQAESRDLNQLPDHIPPLMTFDNLNIITLNDAKNFLYLINPDNYSNKNDYLNDLKSTEHDLLIIDLFFEDEVLTSAEVDELKTKSGGGDRLVIAYMSIGEAEDYRYYWKTEWLKKPPEWLYQENPDWEGNYKVKYWNKQWQAIIYGNKNAYLDKIIAAGFDGVYLDIIDGFEFFESIVE